jgi:YfiR/HmsC-like
MRATGSSVAAILLTVSMAVFSHRVAADDPNEYQVKAVFLFNFSHFVEWPPTAFAGPADPFVIGVLGGDPFGARLDEAVRNERVGEHPIVVRRFRDAADLGSCQLLFIARSQATQLAQILAALGERPVLTVSEMDGAGQRGVMVEFVMESNRIRLRINERAARADGLVISSKLLRLAEIVGGRRD